MDHDEDELYIVMKNKEYECQHDKDFLWQYLNEYFGERKKEMS